MVSQGHSIHYQRRWYYVLWCLLLFGSIRIWVLWETPRISGTAKILVRLQIRNAPSKCRVQAWVGPTQNWEGAAWNGEKAAANAVLNPDSTILPPIVVSVAFRRWIKDYIHHGTSELLVLRIVPPSGPPRYLFFPLADDWRSGFLRVGWVMRMNIPCVWEDLESDAMAFPGE